MSFNDTLNKIQTITDEVSNYSSNLEGHLERWNNNLCETVLKLEKSKADANDRYTNILKAVQEIESQMTTYKGTTEYLANELVESQTKLDSLKQNEAQLELQVLSAEQALQKAKQNLNINDTRLEKQQVLEDRIRAYKLLTGTTFDYSGSGISGYVYKKDTKTYKAFNFDPKENSEKIAEKLWNAVEKVAKE